MKTKHPLPIQSWAEEDRPREKLLLKGRSQLSDAELIGILIGSGTKSLSAVDIAKQILKHVDNNLYELARLSIEDLKKFKGIGEVKAIAITSALELGRRRADKKPVKQQKITSSKDVYVLMKPELLALTHEECWIILLNRAHKVIKKQLISSGGIAGTVVDPKIIFKKALESMASAIILVHNHPSGNIAPSNADCVLTEKLQKAGKFLEIPIIDHIIFSDNRYFSFADENRL